MTCCCGYNTPHRKAAGGSVQLPLQLLVVPCSPAVAPVIGQTSKCSPAVASNSTDVKKWVGQERQKLAKKA